MLNYVQEVTSHVKFRLSPKTRRSLGLSTVWVSKEREIFDSEDGKELLKEWKLPTALRGVEALALGYANEEPKEAAPRKKDYIVKV